MRARWIAAVAWIGLCFGAPVGLATPWSIEASLDRQSVALGERVTLTVTVGGNAQAPRPTLPELPGCHILEAGSQHLVSMVNGQTSTSTVYTYVLVPERQGRLQVPPITLVMGDEQLETRPLALEVGPRGSRAPPPAAPNTPGAKQVPEDAVFLEGVVEPKRAYVGQQVTLIVRFFQGASLANDPSYERPPTPGFWVEELGKPRTYNKHYRDRRYHVTELRSALFPTEAGTKTIGSARVTCELLKGRQRLDPFSLFGRRRGEERRVESQPIELEVLELPTAGRPASWDGAVGQFQLTADVDKRQAEVGEAITLTVAVEGQGNLRSVGEPVIPAVPGLRVYDGGRELVDRTQDDRIGGRLTQRSVWIASKPGDYLFPGVEYASFDPAAAVYRTLQTEPIELHITPATDGGGAEPTGPLPELVVPEPDLSFIRLGDLGLARRRPPLHRRPSFWLLQCVPLAAAALGLGWVRRRERLSGDERYVMARQAASTARARLASGRQALASGHPEGAVSAAAQAVRGYVADRTGLPVASLDGARVRQLLDEHGAAERTVAEVLAFFERVDCVRYAPSSQSAAAASPLVDEAEACLEALAEAGV